MTQIVKSFAACSHDTKTFLTNSVQNSFIKKNAVINCKVSVKWPPQGRQTGTSEFALVLFALCFLCVQACCFIINTTIFTLL